MPGAVGRGLGVRRQRRHHADPRQRPDVHVAYPGATPKEKLDAKTYNTCPGPPDAAFKAKFLTHGL